ncbi:MAG: hypothetical protein HC888_07105 [Candidatus Competibacteraceae bacterium]|nr:hypothetical protein [Candidatus Competibacteraceae bacterium]
MTAAQTTADEALKARAISENINKLLKAAVDVRSNSDFGNPLGQGYYDALKIELKEIGRRFNTLLTDKPEQLHRLKQAIALLEQAITFRATVNQEQMPETEFKRAKLEYRALSEKLRTVLYETLVPMAQEQSALADAGPARQARMNRESQTLLAVLLVLSLFYTAFVGSQFIDKIANRIKICAKTAGALPARDHF